MARKTEIDYMEYSSDALAQAAYVSSGHHAVTFVGTAQLVTAVKKWGSGSLLLDGDSDYLTIPDSVDWNVFASNSDNWTIDLWVKHVDHVGTEIYVSQMEVGDEDGWFLYHSHGTGILVNVYTANVAIITLSGGEITDTDWHHVALCKVADEYGLYKDGVQVDYTQDASVDSYAAGLEIGAFTVGNALFDGHLDEIRIQHSNIFGAVPVVGLTDTITVPTAAHQIDTNTKLLLHFDGVNGAVTTKDSSRCEPYSESTIKQQGSYSLKGIAKQTDSLNDTLTRTVNPTIDLSNKNLISLYVRASRTGSNFKIGFHDSGGTTTEKTIAISSADTWERKFINLEGVANSNKDVIDSIIITITNADADNTIYVDDIYSLMGENTNAFGTNF